MHSSTLLSLFGLLVALLATPSFGDYVERRGYDQGFGALEARDPAPKKRVGSYDKDSSPTETGAAEPTAAASENMANMVGVGIMALVAGGALI